jgi:hypothetical protein
MKELRVKDGLSCLDARRKFLENKPETGTRSYASPLRRPQGTDAATQTTALPNRGKTSSPPRTTVSTQSEVSTQTEDLPTPTVPAEKIRASQPPALEVRQPRNICQNPQSKRHAGLGRVQVHVKSRAMRSPYPTAASPPQIHLIRRRIMWALRKVNTEVDWSDHLLRRRRSFLFCARSFYSWPSIMDLLQWNVSGFRTRLRDLQALIQYCNPAIICLQETHLRPSHALKLRCYTPQRYDHPHGERASRGTAIIVKDCICIPANLRSPLHVIAVRVHLLNLSALLCVIFTCLQ